MNDSRVNGSPRHYNQQQQQQQQQQRYQQHYDQDRSPVHGVKNGKSYRADVQIQCDWTEFPELPDIDPDASNKDASRRAKKMLTNRSHTFDEAEPEQIDESSDKEELIQQLYRSHLRIENLISNLKDYRQRIEDLRRMKQVREQEISRLGIEISRLKEIGTMGQGREREMQSCILDLRMSLQELHDKHRELLTLSSIREAEFNKNSAELQRKIDQLHSEKEKLYMSFLAKGGESGLKAFSSDKPITKREDQPLKLVNRSRRFLPTHITSTFPLPSEVEMSDAEADDPGTSVFLKQSLKNSVILQDALHQSSPSRTMNGFTPSSSTTVTTAASVHVDSLTAVKSAPLVNHNEKGRSLTTGQNTLTTGQNSLTTGQNSLTTGQNSLTTGQNNGTMRGEDKGRRPVSLSPSHNGPISQTNHQSSAPPQSVSLSKSVAARGSLPILSDETVTGRAATSQETSGDNRVRGKLTRSQTVIVTDAQLQANNQPIRQSDTKTVSSNHSESCNLNEFHNGRNSHSATTSDNRSAPVNKALNSIRTEYQSSTLHTSTSEIPNSLEGKASQSSRRYASLPPPSKASAVVYTSDDTSPQAPPRRKRAGREGDVRRDDVRNNDVRRDDVRSNDFRRDNGRDDVRRDDVRRDNNGRDEVRRDDVRAVGDVRTNDDVRNNDVKKSCNNIFHESRGSQRHHPGYGMVDILE